MTSPNNNFMSSGAGNPGGNIPGGNYGIAMGSNPKANQNKTWIILGIIASVLVLVFILCYTGVFSALPYYSEKRVEKLEDFKYQSIKIESVKCEDVEKDKNSSDDADVEKLVKQINEVSPKQYCNLKIDDADDDFKKIGVGIGIWDKGRSANKDIDKGEELQKKLRSVIEAKNKGKSKDKDKDDKEVKFSELQGLKKRSYETKGMKSLSYTQGNIAIRVFLDKDAPDKIKGKDIERYIDGLVLAMVEQIKG